MNKSADSYLTFQLINYYLQHIAQKFPQVKLQTVLDAEKKFNAADVNGDGVRYNKLIVGYSEPGGGVGG